jgi:hypothetical protein
MDALSAAALSAPHLSSIYKECLSTNMVHDTSKVPRSASKEAITIASIASGVSGIMRITLCRIGLRNNYLDCSRIGRNDTASVRCSTQGAGGGWSRAYGLLSLRYAAMEDRMPIVDELGLSETMTTVSGFPRREMNLNADSQDGWSP